MTGKQSRTETKDHLPEDSFNGNLDARPEVDHDEMNVSLEPTKANLRDAKELGYTKKNGQAFEKARPDVEGSPTGAFTDIGAGRSSVVHPTYSKETNSH